MVEIKNTILSGNCADIFDTINEFIFKDDVYHPDNDLIYRRAIILGLFAPDYMKDKNNSADAVFAEEADDIIKSLEENSRQYKEVTTAIDRWINHRLNITENSFGSLTDYALSQFVKTLDEKVRGLDITDEGVKAVTEAVGKSNDKDFANNLVDAFIEKGMLKKPNRATRRANGQTTAKKTTKKKEPIKLDIETKD